MKKMLVLLGVFLMTFTLLTGCSAQKKQTEVLSDREVADVELTILAAASLKDVMVELTTKYKEIAPHVTLTFSYGASGALQTQVEEGVPADIFISAGKKQVDALEGKELLLADTRKDLLLNKIVLITSKDSSLTVSSFEEVAGESVNMIALGEPLSVPVGQYSEEIFTSLGILEQVKAKANYGSDVRQVLTWVETGEVDCGVVYSTDAMISDLVTIQCEAPEGSHKPVVYPVAVLKSSMQVDQSNLFLDFLSSEDAATIFEAFGFKMN